MYQQTRDNMFHLGIDSHMLQMNVPLVCMPETLLLLDRILWDGAGRFINRSVFLLTNPLETRSSLADQVLLLNMVFYSSHGRDAEERKKVKSLSRVQLFEIPWTVAYQAPPSMGFSRREYWRGLPFPSLGDLPDPGIEAGSPAL